MCVFVSVCMCVCVHCRDSGAKWWAQNRVMDNNLYDWGGGRLNSSMSHEFPIFQEEGGGWVLT